MRIQKSVFNNEKPRTLYFVPQKDQMSVKCAPFTGITKGIFKAQSNRYFLVKYVKDN